MARARGGRTQPNSHANRRVSAASLVTRLTGLVPALILGPPHFRSKISYLVAVGVVLCCVVLQDAVLKDAGTRISMAYSEAALCRASTMVVFTFTNWTQLQSR